MTRSRPSNQSATAQKPIRRPLWIPAAAFYVSAVLVGFLIFLSVWTLLIEGGDDSPEGMAGASFALVLGTAAVYREIFLRRARRKFLAVQRRLDENLGSARSHVRPEAAGSSVKLTVKQNAELVARIKRKSDAAKELMTVARGHLEVFELCSEYLELNRAQIESANPGSPRLQDLRSGRESVKKLHHFHLLTWAEIESTALTKVASECDTISAKSSYLRDSLRVLESALSHYPNDPALSASETAVRDLLFSVEITSRIEIAEREAFLGEYESAVRTLRDAVELIDLDGRPGGGREELKRRIELEIHRFANHSRVEWERSGGTSSD